MPRLRPPAGFQTIPAWSRALDRGVTNCRDQVNAGRIAEENLHRTTARLKNRETSFFFDVPVIYVREGTPYPERAWGGRREGAGRKKTTTEGR